MIDWTFQTVEEPSRRCVNTRCSGSIISEKNFVPGSDQFVFTIDRLQWLSYGLEEIGSDTIKEETPFEIPLSDLSITGDSYELTMVIYQVAWKHANGKNDSRNGHVYIDKRVKNKQGMIYWVLLDDEQIEVIREREFEKRLLEKNRDVYALVYKKEENDWDDESSDNLRLLYAQV